MKRSGTCPKCGCTNIVHLKTVADATGGEGAGWAPRKIVQARTTSKSIGLFSDETTTKTELVGITEGYACSECGFLEEYLRNPKNVDWDAAVDIARTHKAGPTPYR